MDLISRNINPPEIWGGAEYSIVRVGNSIYDQLAQSGHESSPDDLNFFSELKIKTIRYPLLWEKYVQDKSKFFELNDRCLNRLEELDIKPVAGLLHHGSGPFFTNLYDKEFPGLFAEFAREIAQRYPSIGLYTPVNEPLTTARFSGLYGVWYPHKNHDRAFVRILLNELKGIILAMQAIRSINPEAGLVQTEDLCRIYSTRSLKYQADFENERKWLTYDLLLGKVDSGHPLWKYFLDQGIQEHELDYFLNNSIIPSVCGFNYYVTSDRFLDNNRSLYPKFYNGGNGMQVYADVEAVRANIPVKISSGDLLKEAWDRYHLPLALTEVHLACSREEQLRWFNEAYQTGTKLRNEGVDFRAITAWSFFGSFDWNSLMLIKNKDYESGVYDIRSGTPRATALAGMIRSINSGAAYKNDLLKMPGWWNRTNRFIFKNENDDNYLIRDSGNYEDVSPLLIIGAKGSLGKAFARICETRGIVHYLSDRSQLDIASEDSVESVLSIIRPWGVINAAGFTRIDDAEKASFTCFRENTIGPSILAETCKKMGIKFVTFSADQVFNGKKKVPYTEADCTQPLNLYGLSKRLAEEKVVKINPDALIIRSSSFFNPWHTGDALGKILRTGISSDQHYYLPSDIIISPSYIPDIVNTVLDLMIDGESGIWHLSNQEEISWFDFARLALNLAGLDETVVSPIPSSKLKYSAARPSYSVLRSSGGITLPLLRNALAGFLNEFYREPSYQIINQPSI